VKILFVGGDFERKGGRLLLDWFAHDPVARRCELHIVTREDVAAADRVFVYRDLPNNGDQLRQLARSCDIFALPTYADCHSLASLEAMASGLPVIATNVGGIPEIVVEGVTGYVIEPGDAHALGDRLRALIEDGDARARMSAAARVRAERSFDARTNVGLVVAQLRRIADSAHDARVPHRRDAADMSQP
jgi:glycosyltransferase involved in cell wall biosynthesis